MNQLERVQGLLTKVTYKPGWKIEALRFRNGLLDDTPSPHRENDYLVPRMGVFYLRVQCEQPDTVTGKPTMITDLTTVTEWALDSMTDAQIVDYLICQAIRKMEDHEFREWFKFDGFCVRDPHPEVSKVA